MCLMPLDEEATYGFLAKSHIVMISISRCTAGILSYPFIDWQIMTIGAMQRNMHSNLCSF